MQDAPKPPIPMGSIRLAGSSTLDTSRRDLLKKNRALHLWNSADVISAFGDTQRRLGRRLRCA